MAVKINASDNGHLLYFSVYWKNCVLLTRSKRKGWDLISRRFTQTSKWLPEFVVSDEALAACDWGAACLFRISQCGGLSDEPEEKVCWLSDLCRCAMLLGLSKVATCRSLSSTAGMASISSRWSFWGWKEKKDKIWKKHEEINTPLDI